jgi:hypothetical protein
VPSEASKVGPTHINHFIILIMGKIGAPVQLLVARIVIVSLFRHKRFQGRWILDANLVTAMKSYFSINDGKWDFTSRELKKALTKDKIYKASGSFWEELKTVNIHNIFRRSYIPRLDAPKEGLIDNANASKPAKYFMYYFVDPSAKKEKQKVPQMVIEGMDLPNFLKKSPFVLGKERIRKMKRPSNEMLDTFMGIQSAKLALAELNRDNSDNLHAINLDKLTGFWQSRKAWDLFAPCEDEDADKAIERHIKNCRRRRAQPRPGKR